MNAPLILSLLLAATPILVVGQSEKGPPGEVKIYDIKDCDSVLNKVEFEAKMQTESDDTDTFSMSFKIPSDYGDNVLVTILADTLDGDEWKENAYHFDDEKFFASVNNFCPKIWEHMRSKMEPKIAEPGEILAGSYTLEGFTATYTEITVPQVPYGKARLTATVTVDDEDVLCQKVELEFFKPSLR
ncbi:hypothetical protein Zmor_022564 [Zophobas morio]|uniref:MD-2-related lipid-recognition domain-containing protein n=1 Tax=Zophobas morio TaxID=2755281 RepID=A0AA38HVJ3_9CUCU|nr:hypothetical protein Zmor_022564 [Zophobas morio]